jgi:hypothetical protein
MNISINLSLLLKILKIVMQKLIWPIFTNKRFLSLNLIPKSTAGLWILRRNLTDKEMMSKICKLNYQDGKFYTTRTIQTWDSVDDFYAVNQTSCVGFDLNTKASSIFVRYKLTLMDLSTKLEEREIYFRDIDFEVKVINDDKTTSIDNDLQTIRIFDLKKFNPYLGSIDEDEKFLSYQHHISYNQDKLSALCETKYKVQLQVIMTDFTLPPY